MYPPEGRRTVTLGTYWPLVLQYSWDISIICSAAGQK